MQNKIIKKATVGNKIKCIIPLSEVISKGKIYPFYLKSLDN